MRPTGADPAGAYFWDNVVPLTFTITAIVHGTRVASATFHQRFSQFLLYEEKEALQADGFIGDFWHPAATSPGRPAILVLGGSAGGCQAACCQPCLPAPAIPP